jgi:hypothetical protein
VVQQGNIGAFDFQTMIVNLTAALGLLSVAALLTDFLMSSVCPLRHVYKQYKVRTTVDFSDLKDAVDVNALMGRFKMDNSLLDPIPPIFAHALSAKQVGRNDQRIELSPIVRQRASVEAMKHRASGGATPSRRSRSDSRSHSVVMNPLPPSPIAR